MVSSFNFLDAPKALEGYYGAKTTYELSTSFNGEYPILQFVYQVLYEKGSAKKKMKALSRVLD